MEILERICDTFPQDSEIDRFEERIGSRLPRDYRRFLLDYNGGRPKASCFSFTTRRGSREDSSLHYFFGLHAGRIGSLERNYALRRERIPVAFLAIATDPFGNLVLIETGDGNPGKIYFWDHELEDDNGNLPSLKNISSVASSFTEFIGALTEAPGHL